MFQNIMVLAEAERSFGFNFDLLESGVVNLAILITLLFFVGRDFLSSNLSGRQDTIVSEIKNADDKLNQALERLQEAKNQATQANLIYQEINAKALNEKLTSLDEDYQNTQQKIIRQCKNGFTVMNVRKLDVLTDIKNDITTNAIYAVIKDLENNFSTADHERLINERISLIKGMA